MLRASTVIVGEVFLVAETDGGEHELTIMVSRPKAKDTDNMYEETFRLYVHPDDGVDISALQAATGRSVNLKGVLAQKGEYDMFEDKFSGPVRPYVKKVKVYA
ncbi:MAG: hypothetical protein HZA22_04550 [Nitrospirae bacterium]|nr:hypothetical protein [Nitrospirota bacterium]